MKFLAGLFLSLALVWPQTCAPRGVLRPADSIRGTLDESNCRLTDGAPYAEYALTLPTRGQLQLSGSGSFNLILTLRDAQGRALATGAGISLAAERGPYVVVAAGGAPDQAGGFTLLSAFTPEPGTLCRDFPSIGLNQTVTGRLAGSACRLPDGTAFDGYLLASLGSGTLNITMTSGDFSPWVLVRDDAGHLLEAGDTVSLPMDGDQAYTILASAADASAGGQYQLALSFTPAAEETCRSLKTFTDSGSDQGTISSKSCTFTADGAASTSQYNYYDVQVPQAGIAEFRLSAAATFYPYLLLLDSSGAAIQGDGWSGGPGLAVIRQQLAPGHYILQAFSTSPAGGDYTLQYTFRPGLPLICPVLTLAPGTPAQGSLSEGSCRTQEGISDVYRIELPSSGTLDLAMTSNDFVPTPVLRDARDNRIVIDHNWGGYTDAHITADLPAGTYSVVAGTSGAPGAYNIGYQLTPHDLAPCGKVQKLDAPAAYQGVFNSSSCRGPNGQAADIYEITTAAGGTLAAVMTSPVIDGFLTLQGADGTTLRWDDNSYGNGDAIVIQFLPGQTYHVSAGTSDAAASGYYRLDLLFAPGGRPPGCAPLSALGIGDTVSGNLSFVSCQYVDDTFADIYQLNVSDTTTLEVRLDSADFDAYLQLLDSKGNVVDSDDNSGGGTNARVLDNLDPGAYYLIAKPFGDYTSTGSYTLQIAAR